MSATLLVCKHAGLGIWGSVCGSGLLPTARLSKSTSGMTLKTLGDGSENGQATMALQVWAVTVGAQIQQRTLHWSH